MVAPNVTEAEVEAVGHEFNDLRRSRSRAHRPAGDLALGEAIVTMADGCVAIVGEGAERRRYEARISSSP